jgi:hypothetical protein
MITRRVKIRALRTSLFATLLVLALCAASQAGPLGVNIDPFPDISSQGIATSYNATTGLFSAVGWAMTLDTGTGAQNITTNFRLQATIDKTGAASGGTLTIGSTLSPLVYSATLLGFAFNAVQGGALEFLFGTPSGSYVPNIYSSLKPLDVMLSAGNSFLGSFGSTWSGTGGTAELRPDPPPNPNPEPSALLLMLVAAAGLGATTLYGQRTGWALSRR